MASILYMQDETSDFTHTSIMDGLEYSVQMLWNDASTSWYISIADYTGTVIISGVRLVSEYPLLTIYNSQDVPAGMLVCRQLSGSSIVSPTRDSFNDGTHELVYLTEEEADEISS